MDLIALKYVDKSQTLLINEQSRMLEANGQKVYKLGFGQSPFPPPPHVQEALRKHASIHDYTPVQGLSSLRDAVARFHSELNGFNIDREQVIIGTGSKILIYCIMASFEKAEIYIPTPAWVSYEPQAHLIGHPVKRLQTSFQSHWKLTPEQLDEALLKKKPSYQPILILNYPDNPGGISYTTKELEALSTILRRHGVLVIADEIYGFVQHHGQHRSLASSYREGTIITSGLSKWCGAGGWRLGIAIVPKGLEGLVETLTGIASETYSCAASPIQKAAESAYTITDLNYEYMRNQQRILRLIGQYCANKLHEVGVWIHNPDGGFYLFPDFTPLAYHLRAYHILTSTELCNRILSDTGVALLPGDAFGMPPNHLTARLAFVDFNGQNALEAAKAVPLGFDLPNSFLHEHCAHLVEGIERLCNWLDNLTLESQK